ncbi:hypothetical protein [Flagellimonas onchidii]|nr:hypothetical protein [Allomuricauda onchidii]
MKNLSKVANELKTKKIESLHLIKGGSGGPVIKKKKMVKMRH